MHEGKNDYLITEVFILWKKVAENVPVNKCQ
jgi:hypothetical protein